MAWSAGALVANLRDREKWAWCADWLAILVAVALPWSTTATVILLLLALLAGIGARDFKGWRDQALTPAGGLPIALWALALIGMLWADAPPAERIDGMSSLTKLLAIPVLLAHFRRSDRGLWVLIGFVASSAILLVLSWGLALISDLPWRGIPDGTFPKEARDLGGQVSQVLCIMRIEPSEELKRCRNRRRVLAAGAAPPSFEIPPNCSQENDAEHLSFLCSKDLAPTPGQPEALSAPTHRQRTRAFPLQGIAGH